jgi:hypothetical protein
MVYGATGRLGELIIQKALAQGLTPIMGGRSIARLRAMADKYQLPWRLIDLDQPQQSAKAFSGIDFVYSAATEETLPGLVELCQSTDTQLLVPHQVSETVSKQVSEAVALAGQAPAVITGAGFHTAATESLLAVAQSQPNAADFSVFHVALLGLPFLNPGYTREFLRRVKQPVSPLPAVPRAKRQGRWHDALLKEMALHANQSWRGLGGKSLSGMRWWSVNASELVVAPRRFAQSPMAVYLPVAPWLLPMLKHFSGLATSLLEPALGRAAQMPSLATLAPRVGGKDKEPSGVLNGLTTFAAHLMTRQGRGASRAAVWLVAQHSDGQFSRFGIEFPAVYDMVSSLAVVLARDLLGKPVSSRQESGVLLEPGVQTTIECFGPDVVLSVPDTLRFGALKKYPAPSATATVSAVAERDVALL